MEVIDVLQAKIRLSRLVQAIEQGQEREIIIARDGRPVAKLVSLEAVPAAKRIGVAKGAFEVPDFMDTHNEEIAELFTKQGNV